jgi:polyhydroxyalkanoate synthesis regulator phasin
MLELEHCHGDLETANAQRRVTISQLEQRLEDREMNSGLVDELREQVDALEEQLARLQTQVRTY